MQGKIGKNGGYYGGGMPEVKGDERIEDRASLFIADAG